MVKESPIIRGVRRHGKLNITHFVRMFGRMFPVTGTVKRPKGKAIPVIDIPWMSDIKWQRDGYEDRLHRPEVYRDNLGEDVPQVLARLRAWLSENDPQSEAFFALMEERYGKETA